MNLTPSKIDQITRYLFLVAPPTHADVALVFGTRHSEAVRRAAALYTDGWVPKIVVSGGRNPVTGENEAETMAAALRSLGVLAADLILELSATNSLENVLLARAAIDQALGLSNIRRLIAVVKHYHARRALMTLRRHFPKSITLIPAAYPIYGFTRDDWYYSPVGQEKVLGEWHKIPEYLAKGDITELGEQSEQ